MQAIILSPILKVLMTLKMCLSAKNYLRANQLEEFFLQNIYSHAE